MCGERVDSFLCITSCVLDKLLMVAFPNTTKDIYGTTKQDEVVYKFGEGMHFGEFPSLTYYDTIIVSPWKLCFNEFHKFSND